MARFFAILGISALITGFARINNIPGPPLGWLLFFIIAAIILLNLNKRRHPVAKKVRNDLLALWVFVSIVGHTAKISNNVLLCVVGLAFIVIAASITAIKYLDGKYCKIPRKNRKDEEDENSLIKFFVVLGAFNLLISVAFNIEYPRINLVAPLDIASLSFLVVAMCIALKRYADCPYLIRIRNRQK